MSETLFIADVHLSPTRPALLTFFLDFLKSRAYQAEALYILGDLFELWIGDDEEEVCYQQIFKALRYLTQQLAVFVMPGNRDFLLGEGFCKVTGCQLLPESVTTAIYGIPTLLMHGDCLCTLDLEYQTFRQQTRNPAWQQWFLAQPLAQRRHLAQQARAQSQVYTQAATETVMEVTAEAVNAVLEKHKVYHLIHGHTHRPAEHQWLLNGQPAYRHVLGTWHDQQAIGLSCSPTSCQLVSFHTRSD